MKTLNVMINQISLKTFFTITAAIFLLLILVSCQADPGNIESGIPSSTPSADKLSTSPTPQPALTGPEMTPASKFYTITGITPGNTLDIFQDPSNNSNIIGQINSSAINLRPSSNILNADGSTWIQIQSDEQNGWVDFSFLAEQQGELPGELVLLGQNVLSALKSFQYDQLRAIIHPELCLRFSPYAYLNTSNLVFCESDIDGSAVSEDLLLWGSYDGTGDPIYLSFRQYHEEFIYDQDYFHSPIIGFNTKVSSGNSLNNIQEIYPGGMMIEYYFPGFDPQYGGMDWRSIRLVFIQHGMDWFLTAIIHGEWTI
jgi:hypothetical protein